jgi:3D (Asp-Asp-Asp) domain-containing protein
MLLGSWHLTIGLEKPELMKSTFIGSAVSVLLVFSAISYAKDYVQGQDPKPTQQQAQPSVPQVQTSNQKPGSLPATGQPAAESAKQESPISDPSSLTSVPKTRVEPVSAMDDSGSEPVVAAQTYTATAYSLRGRTASGRPVSRGLIAADPSVLPLGTRVRVEAGSFTGEYVVADTGGAVRGRRIDIWTPTSREAMQFGRRAVKLTVLSFGGKRAKSASVRPRQVHGLSTTISPALQPAVKQQK